MQNEIRGNIIGRNEIGSNEKTPLFVIRFIKKVPYLI